MWCVREFGSASAQEGIKMSGKHIALHRGRGWVQPEARGCNTLKHSKMGCRHKQTEDAGSLSWEQSLHTHLSDLPALVIPTYQRDSVRIPHLRAEAGKQ